LDSDTFAVREKAQKELRRFAEQAEPALRKALEGKPSAEGAPQLEQLLSGQDGPGTNPDRLRLLRGGGAAGRIGTPAGRRGPEGLAKGAPAAKLTQEAKASLARLSAR